MQLEDLFASEKLMIELPLPNWMRSEGYAEESCAGLVLLQTKIHRSLRCLFEALALGDSLLTEKEKLSLANLLDKSHVSSTFCEMHRLPDN